MPSYSFKCSDCENIFDVQCRISEMTEQECPNCHSKKYETHHTGRQALIDPVRLGIKKADGGFNEVLSKIASANYKSNLTDKLSRR
jgi:putative FmdB family regulatory protein